MTYTFAGGRACSEDGPVNWPSRFFVWKEDLDLGIPRIDADHQRFLALMSDLHSALHRGKARNHIHAIMGGLKAYATYHFIREEDLMGAAGYPGLHTHQVQHAWYLYYLKNLEGQAVADSILACETMHFMRDWFVDHILGIDKRFSEWLAATEGVETVALDPEAEQTTEGLRCTS